MSTLFKDVFCLPFYKSFCKAFSPLSPLFDSQLFIDKIFIDEFESFELKERISHTAKVFSEFMPQNFPEASELLIEFVDHLTSLGVKRDGIEYLFLSDYIWMYGIDDLESSIKAIEVVTQFVTCEFSVRPFILKYPDVMMKQMVDWSTHESEYVRRLSSEGSRPRLPWAMALPLFKKDPSPLFKILENLRYDSSEYVRRSVANNLNDISKDHPDVLMSFVKKWKGVSKETDWLLKHASRTLLKKGDSTTLALFGLDSSGLEVSDFKVDTPLVNIGERVSFSFILKNKINGTKRVRLEYAIYFMLKNGKQSKKVFKISEKDIGKGYNERVLRTHSFRFITTRTYYPGEHKVSVIVNGKESEHLSFDYILLGN
ncbi:DNA alkylation repair protein [bacterium]|jgi:3-methyladenine DNA glycosylase AlkC|nr:DNA alkylation repair protein [bacterium]